MDSQTINEIRSKIPDFIRERYPVQVWSLQELGGYQNCVYQITCDDTPLILRVTPASHRCLPHLQAEIALVSRLHERGVPVAAPVNVPGFSAIERVKLHRNTYYISVFEKAPGLTWRDVPQGENDYFQAGSVLGRIHRETAGLPDTLSRPSWDENHYIRRAKRVIPREKLWVVHRMNEHIARLRELPRDEGQFGLVHGDYNFANMLYSPEGITVIDFDEAEYHWYIYDLAVYIFYYLLGNNPADMDLDSARIVWSRFLEGYAGECSIPVNLVERLGDFLRLREFVLYSSICGSLTRRSLGAWQKSFLQEAEQRFETGRPLVDVEKLHIG